MLFFVVFAGINLGVYGRGVSEEDVPMPAVQHVLPQAIVGEFTMIAFPDEYKLTIYPNNKFLLVGRGYDTAGEGVAYGHVIEKDGVYYFNPIGSISRNEFDGLTEIYMSETGFSFYLRNHLYLKDFLFKAVRTPRPEHIADTITIPKKRTKQQYYIVDRHNRRVPLYAEGSSFKPYEFSYSLAIDKGLVALSDEILHGDVYIPMDIIRSGFLITTVDDGENFSGKIQFTNTPAFYNIVDGSAAIEKKGDSIIITAVSTEYIEEELRKIYSIESPVYLVLEF
jgi:hypothetical protein